MFCSSIYVTLSTQNDIKRDEKLIFMYGRLIEITQTQVSMEELCGRDSGWLVYRDQELKSQVIHEQQVKSGESGAQLDTSVSNRSRYTLG